MSTVPNGSTIECLGPSNPFHKYADLELWVNNSAPHPGDKVVGGDPDTGVIFCQSDAPGYPETKSPKTANQSPITAGGVALKLVA